VTSGLFARGFAALIAVGLVVGVLELSCLASERRVAATTGVLTDAIEPDLPVASEVEGGAYDESAALTF